MKRFRDRIERHAEILKEPLEEPPPELTAELTADIKLDEYIIGTDIPGVSLIKAGRFDQDYASRVNTFNGSASTTSRRG